MAARDVIATVAFAIIAVAMLVAGRYVLCLVYSIRCRSYRAIALSVMGLVTIVGALGAVVVVWFAYAVAHTGKSAETDLYMFLATVPPFFLVSAGLWIVGRKLRNSALERAARQPLAD